MTAVDFLVHSQLSKNGGELLSLSRDAAGWEWMCFLRRLGRGRRRWKHKTDQFYVSMTAQVEVA